VAAYLALAVVMNDPPYFIMARIDLTGSSTGWHRAELIRAAFAHLSEWWIAGTDYTRHWMPYGINWSPDHSDITNHYLQMGVLGGIPLMLLFGFGVSAGFGLVGRALQNDATPARPFYVWAIGASLFAHALTFLSVTYYDQSIAFFYLTLAATAATTTAVHGVTPADVARPSPPLTMRERLIREDGGQPRWAPTAANRGVVRSRKRF
jgi:hypothetical protein